MTDQEISEAYISLAQENRDVFSMMSASEYHDLKIEELYEDESSIFLDSRMGQEPHEFLDGIYKIVDVIGVTSRVKADLAYYLSKEISQIWIIQWKDNRNSRKG